MHEDGFGSAVALTEGPWAGWHGWFDPYPDTFLEAIGRSYLRAAAPGRAQVALETRTGHRNRRGTLHGGFVAAFADHAFFAGLWVMGHKAQANGLTIDLSMQYLGAGRPGPALIADVELLRETGRMMFLRLVMTQEGAPVAASSATIRKLSTVS